MNEQMIKKNNMKIFPIYKMFGWDLLFYYAIIFLFLTQVKGFTASQILIADAAYSFFRIIFQIPCINIIDLIGKQKSLLLGNILVTISIIGVTIGNSFTLLIVLYFFEAMGYNFKGLCEPTILSDSIPKSSVSLKIYSKIDGKGSSNYYFFDAISSITTGFLYVINPYIPMILCCIFCIISTLISLSFEEPDVNKKEKNKSVGFVEHYKDIFSIFKQIKNSNRLKSLLAFSLCFRGITVIFGTLRSSILVDIGMPEQYFGIIIAVMQIVSSISSKNQHLFHNKFKNRTLSWFSLSVATSYITMGIVVICNINYAVSLILVLSTIILMGAILGPYFTLMQRYLNSFSNPNVNTKIFAINSLLENLGRVFISLFASLLLGLMTTAYAFVIIGCIFFIIFIILLNIMKSKVGLKPEEYSEKDLVFATEEERRFK